MVKLLYVISYPLGRALPLLSLQSKIEDTSQSDNKVNIPLNKGSNVIVTFVV